MEKAAYKIHKFPDKYEQAILEKASITKGWEEKDNRII
jgi:hypothetical protein